MYAVVGCTECSALWLLDGRPDRSECPRCGRSHSTDRLKRFVETDDKDHAREVRASMLANRQGAGDAFAELDSIDEMEAQLDDAGIDDETYLEASGLDPDAVQDGAEELHSGGSSRSKQEIVRDGLAELDRPTEAELIDYAAEHGVGESYVRDAVEKLVRRGELSEHRGEYRLL